MARILTGPARPPVRWLLGIALLTLLVGGAGGLLPVAQAATITVTTFEDQLDDAAPCSLREAVLSANDDSAIGGCTAGSGADTILLAAGEYHLRISANASLIDEEVGDLDLTSDITLIGQGPGVTVIDGAWRFDSQSDRILEIGQPLLPRSEGAAALPNVVVENLTIQDGEPAFGLGPDSPVDVTNLGGGILVQTGANLVARNVVVDHNAADEGPGGGLGVAIDGAAQLENVHFTRNLAIRGGAIWNGGTLSMHGGAIGTFLGIRDRWPDRNSTQFGNGGGLYNEGVATLADVSIVGNLAHDGDGGGIYNTNELTLDRGVIYSNHAQDDGGGIYNTEDSLFTLSLTNVTLSTNSADDHGGGLYNLGTSNLTNVTVAFNRADDDNNDTGDGGGIFEPTPETVNLKNTIVAGNLDRTIEGNVHPDCSGPMASQGNNLIQNPAGCTGFVASDLIGSDPGLVPLADNGGPTFTHMLRDWSPAIDRSGPAPSTDQRGVPRPYGKVADIGAYERFLCFKQPINSVGTQGNDVIDERGEPPTDVILSLGGNDRILAGPGKDYVCTGDGKDTVLAGGGRDKVNGQGGDDTLRGGGNPDLLKGGPGDDNLVGGGTLRDDGDKCRGGPGNDFARGCEQESSIP